MADQNYKTHRRFVPLYHFVLSLLLLAGLGGSVVNLWKSHDPHVHYSAALILLVFVCLILVYYFVRAFALKAQDRAIRAEENLRHYVLTGSLLDARLTTRQIVGLRFAADGEFQELAGKAAAEGLSEEAIKRSIKDWRGDHYRV